MSLLLQAASFRSAGTTTSPWAGPNKSHSPISATREADSFIGGHNLLEPAALGVPVVTGPYNFNAQDIADLFIQKGACRRVGDPKELAETVSELLANPDEAGRLGRAGQRLLEENRGALERLLVLLEPLLGARGATRPT